MQSVRANHLTLDRNHAGISDQLTSRNTAAIKYNVVTTGQKLTERERETEKERERERERERQTKRQTEKQADAQNGLTKSLHFTEDKTLEWRRKSTRPCGPIGATCGSLNKCVTDRLTDWPTDRPTDTASYRGTLSHLKTRYRRKDGIEDQRNSSTLSALLNQAMTISWGG